MRTAWFLGVLFGVPAAYHLLGGTAAAALFAITLMAAKSTLEELQELPNVPTTTTWVVVVGRLLACLIVGALLGGGWFLVGVPLTTVIFSGFIGFVAGNAVDEWRRSH